MYAHDMCVQGMLGYVEGVGLTRTCTFGSRL